MTRSIEKRPYDARLYDIDCSDLLADSETITGTPVMSSDAAGFSFGAPSINTETVTYDKGRTAPAGKVIQVEISGGTLPTGRTELYCLMRAQFETNLSPQLEATFFILLTDRPRI